MLSFSYAAVRLSEARQALMAPHPLGEAASYTAAFHGCASVLDSVWPIPRDELDPQARAWVATIEGVMDTTGIEDPTGRGTFAIRADQLTNDEKREFSAALDGLADWFRDAADAQRRGK